MFECRRNVNFLRALEQQIIISVSVIIIIKLIKTAMIMMMTIISYLCHPIENHVDEHKSSRSTNSVTGDHHCVYHHYSVVVVYNMMMILMNDNTCNGWWWGRSGLCMTCSLSWLGPSQWSIQNKNETFSWRRQKCWWSNTHCQTFLQPSLFYQSLDRFALVFFCCNMPPQDSSRKII